MSRLKINKPLIIVAVFEENRRFLDDFE